MPAKPGNLIYGLDDRPPVWASLVLGLQHLSMVSIALIFPVVLIRTVGGSAETARTLVSMSVLAAGVGVILQALKKGPVGSGYLCPQVCGPSYMSASLLALQTGGVSLLLGMTVFAGALESLLSRVMIRLRFLFPAEVTGLIVTMVGASVIEVAAQNFLGLGRGDNVTTVPEITVAIITLATMVGLNVWSAGKLRLFCIILAMAVGYGSSWAMGLLHHEHLAFITNSALLAWPFGGHPGWSFDLSLVVPMTVAVLCSTLKSVGDLTTCQKINDAHWKRPDMNNIKKGILADALGCLSAGLLGGMGQSTSSANVGLSLATGATSRVVAWFLGGLLIFMAFSPMMDSVFAVMPRPVMGAALIFVVGFMIVAGLQIIVSRMLDARKTFVVGLSIIFGLSVDMMPSAFTGLHPWLQPIFSSSLSAAAVLAVVLNLVFRIGIAQKASLKLDPSSDLSQAVFDFVEHWGKAWGARREVMYQAGSAMTEVAETLSAMGMATGPVSFEMAFEELMLRVKISYEGRPLRIPQKAPSQEEILKDEDGLAGLSGYLVGSFADRVKVSESNGHCRLLMEFNH